MSKGIDTSELEDIVYRMYENSGNSKYIRAEWANKPFHPDNAVKAIKAWHLSQLEEFGNKIIGEDDNRPTNGHIGAASNIGTVESMFYTSRKDLRAQQRNRLSTELERMKGENDE